jgi:hypothetical protein
MYSIGSFEKSLSSPPIRGIGCISKPVRHNNFSANGCSTDGLARDSDPAMTARDYVPEEAATGANRPWADNGRGFPS